LLDGVGGDGGEALLEVPGAAALRIAQPSHDPEQPLERRSGAGRIAGTVRHGATLAKRPRPGKQRRGAGTQPPAGRSMIRIMYIMENKKIAQEAGACRPPFKLYGVSPPSSGRPLRWAGFPGRAV